MRELKITNFWSLPMIVLLRPFILFECLENKRMITCTYLNFCSSPVSILNQLHARKLVVVINLMLECQYYGCCHGHWLDMRH